MATQLQMRRGTASQNSSFTGAEGEVSVNTTNDSLHIHDGSTAGGFELARADLNNVSDTSLNAALTGNTVSALTITTLTLGATAITATGTELNLLDGVTATTAELNYVDGVTSAIQTQIDTKAPLASPTFTGTVTAGGITNAGDITLGAGDKLQYNSDRYFTPENNIDGAEVSANGVFRVKTGATPASRLLVGGTGDISFYNSSGTSQSLFWDASAERLGIGTTSQTAALHVINSAASGESIAVLEAASTKNGYVYVNADDNRRKSLIFQSGGVDKFSMGVGDSDELSSSSFFIGSGKHGGSGADLVIDSSGSVGIGASSPARALHVNSGSDNDCARFQSTDTEVAVSFVDTTGTSEIKCRNDFRFHAGGSERMRLDSSGHITSLPTYNNGSASSANMVVNSSGVFLRSVSSAKYKTDIEDVQDAYVDSLLNIRPVYYRSTLENDNTEHSHWGFIAEEVAEIDPRLVHYKTVDVSYGDNGERVETELETPEPEGVQYDRFAPLMLKLIQKQQATITALEARITQLENN